jgi:Asp-tRNA(Asn)/Glu-tRNA(Gln) amidotransferase A subunit family amidase
MSDQPWLGDACSLVDAFRAGELSPVEALEATLGAVERSQLNAFCHIDPERSRAWAESADVSQPFGGVPIGVKEIDGSVEGWPDTHASLVFADNIAPTTSTQVARLIHAGAVPAGLTNASEFGGINCTHTKLHGTTRNPWNLSRTPGGSTGGGAAAVAGGLVTLSTGGDGGGSIRIPAGFCGLLGLKHTFGRIPRGPVTEIGALTVTIGCVSRSVRDTARWLDVCNGHDGHDPLSLPRVDGWEAGLGSHDLAGKRVAIAPTLGAAFLHPEVERTVRAAAEALAKDARLRILDLEVRLPELSLEWALAGMIGLRQLLGDRYPACEHELTPEIQFGLSLAMSLLTLDGAARVEGQRQQFNETMATLFEQVDFVMASTNPDVAFTAEGPLPTAIGDIDLTQQLGYEKALGNHGALTIPSNIYGSPAVSIPAGTVEGLPVGLQVLTRHHQEALLLDLALIAERERPWPLVAPALPC